MSDAIEDVIKKSEARVSGLRAGLDIEQKKLQSLREAKAGIEAQMMTTMDVINATGGRLQEAEEMLKVLRDANSLQDQDYPRFGQKTPASDDGPAPDAAG